MHNDALLLLSKLYDAPSIPRNHVQLVVNMTQSFMKEGLDMLREKVVNCLKTLGDCDDSINEVSSMFEILQQPFKILKVSICGLNSLKFLVT